MLRQIATATPDFGDRALRFRRALRAPRPRAASCLRGTRGRRRRRSRCSRCGRRRRTCRSPRPCRRRPRSRTRSMAAIASAIAFVPCGERRRTRTRRPARSRRSCRPCAMISLRARRPTCGPTSRMRSSGSTSSIALSVGVRVCRERLRARPRRSGPAPCPGNASRIAFASPTSSGSASDLPMRPPAARMNVLAMPPPTISTSTFAASARRIGELGRHLRSADDGDQRPRADSRARAPARRAPPPSADRRRRPARTLAMPCVVASARCAVPNASLT